MPENHHISAVIITLNEENNLRTCLQSLVEVADEILVIDSGSTDQTLAIAEEHGADVIHTEWLGYAATKNFGNEKAKHQMILSLDADEELSAELQEKIIGLKSAGMNSAYELDRHNFYLGKWIKRGGWWPDYKVRLFDRSKARWVGDFVHETLELDTGITPARLQGALNHYSIQSVDQHKATVRKYAQLAAQREHSKGKKRRVVTAALSAAFTFLKIYLLKGGFIEGLRGFRIARYSAWSKWLRYKYLKEIGA